MFGFGGSDRRRGFVSFVLHMIERFGLPAVLQFFRPVNNRNGSLDAIRARMVLVFGVSLEDVEATWLAMLRGDEVAAPPGWLLTCSGACACRIPCGSLRRSDRYWESEKEAR